MPHNSRNGRQVSKLQDPEQTQMNKATKFILIIIIIINKEIKKWRFINSIYLGRQEFKDVRKEFGRDFAENPTLYPLWNDVVSLVVVIVVVLLLIFINKLRSFCVWLFLYRFPIFLQYKFQIGIRNFVEKGNQFQGKGKRQTWSETERTSDSRKWAKFSSSSSNTTVVVVVVVIFCYSSYRTPLPS